MTTYFKTLNTGDLAKDSYAELKWTPDRDIILKKVVLTERNDYSLSPVHCFIKIADVPYTFEYITGTVVGQNLEYCWKPELKVTKGALIYFKILNKGTPTVNIDLTFEYE